MAPRDEDAKGPNPTIASYIAENNIQETPIKLGDPGSPTIDLPVPDGWETAGADTPDWAYGAIVYTGPEAVRVHAEHRCAGVEADRQCRPAEDHRPGARRVHGLRMTKAAT